MTRARDVANIDGLLTTTGDTYYASAAGTPARLGIGSSAQVLTVASGVPSWATPAGGGGMTLLSTTTLSGTSTTISSIDQTYIRLIVYIYGVTNTTASGAFYVLANSTANIYPFTAVSTDTSIASYNYQIYLQTISNAPLYTNALNSHTLILDNYAAANYKTFDVFGSYSDNTPTIHGYSGRGSVATNTAISSLVFKKDGGGSFNAGTVLIYGVK